VTRQLILGIGGPAYTGVVRTEHATHVANVVAEAYRNNIDVRVNYLSSTLVGDCRANLLTNAIDRGYDVLLSIDSDTWGPIGAADPIWNACFSLVSFAALASEPDVAARYWAPDEIRAASQMPAIAAGNLALMSMAVATKDRQLNVWRNDKMRMSTEDFTTPVRRVWATGMAYTFFNVAWYRNNRHVARRFDTTVDMMSEDICHCVHVLDNRGECWAGFGTTYHKPWGSDEILVIKPEYQSQPENIEAP